MNLCLDWQKTETNLFLDGINVDRRILLFEFPNLILLHPDSRLELGLVVQPIGQVFGLSFLGLTVALQCLVLGLMLSNACSNLIIGSFYCEDWLKNMHLKKILVCVFVSWWYLIKIVLLLL